MFKSAVALAFIAGISTSYAQTPPTSPCMPFEMLQKVTKDNYSEVVTLGGKLPNNQGLMILFSSPSGETWTLAMLRPDGVACIVAGGTDMKLMKPQGQRI